MMKLSKLALLASIYFLCCGYITTTYYTQWTEKIGIGSEISGYVDVVYETGGIEWKEPEKKFKAIWGVDFEPNYCWDDCEILSYYDRNSSKIKMYNLYDWSEVTNTYIVTNTYFTLKGRK